MITSVVGRTVVVVGRLSHQVAGRSFVLREKEVRRHLNPPIDGDVDIFLRCLVLLTNLVALHFLHFTRSGSPGFRKLGFCGRPLRLGGRSGGRVFVVVPQGGNCAGDEGSGGESVTFDAAAGYGQLGRMFVAGYAFDTR